MCHAPQPHVPGASDVISTVDRWDGGWRNDTPFHSWRNICHQAKSDLNAKFSLIGTFECGGRWTPCNRSSIAHDFARVFEMAD